MDRNTVIGFILIIAVVIGFTLYTRPSEEEIARQEYVQDSIRQAQAQQVKEDIEQANKVEETKKEEVNKVDSFFNANNNQPIAATNDTTAVQKDSASLQKPQPAIALEEKTITIENEKLKLDVSTKGGQIKNIQLKGYSDYKGDSLNVFGEKSSMSLALTNKSNQTLHTDEAIFTPIVGQDNRTLTMRLSYGDGQHLDFIYALSPDSYMIKFEIVAEGMKDMLDRNSSLNAFPVTWKQMLNRKEKSVQNEQRYAQIYYKLEGQDVEHMSESKNESEEITSPIRWIAFKDQFFATAIIGDNPFETSVLNTKMIENNPDYLKDYEATLYAPVSYENNGVLRTGYRIFAGPLEYYMLKGYDDGVKETDKQLDLDKLVPLGWTVFRWVNQYFVLPLFSLLKTSGLSMGIIILLLTLIVKLIISPLTYKSFMSSAKMRVLRPQVEEINKKYPKQDQAMDKQKATMELYRKAGVNPMSGCIPMLLQMPVLLALFSFFPSLIDLRHESFLWANDLSTYDAIIEWSGNIPIISWALGNHVSLFCVLMTATNIVYTKFNMDATNTGQQQMPGMKWMMYLMPLVFLFVLNNYPSGLTYYYFVSTLITILLTLIFRFAINEEKVLAKLEANKLKPKKKSGFMARLEEAQRLQQQQAKQQSKSNSTKKRR